MADPTGVAAACRHDPQRQRFQRLPERVLDFQVRHLSAHCTVTQTRLTARAVFGVVGVEW